MPGDLELAFVAFAK